MATEPQGPTWASDKSQDQIESDVRAFFDDDSNPVDAFTRPYLTREGLEDLRRRVRLHASKEWIEQREGYLVPEVYTDELLALIERVIRLEDGLTRIYRDTHHADCTSSDPIYYSCECAQDIAQEALGLD